MSKVVEPFLNVTVTVLAVHTAKRVVSSSPSAEAVVPSVSDAAEKSASLSVTAAESGEVASGSRLFSPAVALGASAVSAAAVGSAIEARALPATSDMVAASPGFQVGTVAVGTRDQPARM